MLATIVAQVDRVAVRAHAQRMKLRKSHILQPLSLPKPIEQDVQHARGKRRQRKRALLVQRLQVFHVCRDQLCFFQQPTGNGSYRHWQELVSLRSGFRATLLDSGPSMALALTSWGSSWGSSSVLVDRVGRSGWHRA